MTASVALACDETPSSNVSPRQEGEIVITVGYFPIAQFLYWYSPQTPRNTMWVVGAHREKPQPEEL